MSRSSLLLTLLAATLLISAGTIDLDHLFNYANPNNTNLDPRLNGAPGGPGGPSVQPQNLQLTPNEKAALVAFLRTLTGSALYTEEKWSNPFDSLGNLVLLPIVNTTFPMTHSPHRSASILLTSHLQFQTHFFSTNKSVEL